MPSILESLPSINIKQRIAVIMILTGISRLRMSRLVENPAINAQIPTTTRPLNMLEPTTLLIAMSLLPERAALKEWNDIKRDLYRIKNELIKVSLIVIITGCSA